MEAKIRKTIRLSEKDYCMIESIQKEQKLPDFSKTLSYILHEYSKKEEDNCRLRERNLKLEENEQKQMTRVRLASNGADVNGQVVVEVLNTLCWQFQASEFHSTEQMLHPVIEEAQITVKDRIARFKQAKDSKTKS